MCVVFCYVCIGASTVDLECYYLQSNQLHSMYMYHIIMVIMIYISTPMNRDKIHYIGIIHEGRATED